MNNKEELEDTLARIKATFVLREGTLALFLVTVILFEVSGLTYYFKQMEWVTLALVLWLITSIIFRYLVQKQTTPLAISNLYFGYDALIELPLLATIVYYVGGVEWMGAMFFLFPIVFTNIFFTKKRAILICSIAGIYYILLALLPYFNLIPFSPYFQLEINLYQHPNYVIANILFAVSTFYLIGLTTNITTDLLKKRTILLRKKTIELGKTKGELEKERVSLEARIKDRTEELENLAGGLEKKVKERTKELQERIDELEKFHKLTVGRELKMVELKEEISELKKELQKYKS